jgi:hypothetical protein
MWFTTRREHRRGCHHEPVEGKTDEVVLLPDDRVEGKGEGILPGTELRAKKSLGMPKGQVAQGRTVILVNESSQEACRLALVRDHWAAIL